MYFQTRQFTTLLNSLEDLACIRCNADRSLVACCSRSCIDVWKIHPSIRLFRYQRSEDSLKEYGGNSQLQWRHDGTGMAIVTDTTFILLFEVKINIQSPTSYQCVDKQGYPLHDTVGTTVPSILIEVVNIVDAHHHITSMAALNNNLTLCTTSDGMIRQFIWDDGLLLEESDCRVSQFLFTDPSQHSYTPEETIYINTFCYSQALELAAVTFSNGRGAYLASSDFFKPGTVHALLAPGLDNAVCASINPRYHLVVFGTATGEIHVYILNYDNGLLNFSHKVTCYTDEMEGGRTPDRTPISHIFWSPDGCCLCSCSESGSLNMWSVYGIFLYSSSRGIKQGSWDKEGYNLWAVSGLKMLKIPFLKSPLTVNNVTNNQHHIILQSANQVYILPNQFPSKSGLSVYESIYLQETQSRETPYESFLTSLGSPLENWPWQVIKIPDVYSNSNFPIRYVAIGASGQCTAVAGLRGFAFYISAKHKWRCFGNEAQEQSLTVRGGMVWWQGILIVAAHLPDENKNFIYMYPHHASIDQTSLVDNIPISHSIITMNTYENYLAVVTGASRVLVFLLHKKVSPSLLVEVSHQKIIEFSIAKYTPHPTAVLSVHVSPLLADASVPNEFLKSVLINVAGKLLMFEISDAGDIGKPITIATNVESVSCPVLPGHYLAAALWLNCGSRGLRVWLPLHGPEGDLSSRRILLAMQHNVYPLVVHHREAAVLGMPLDSLKCRSETFLHELLHQLVVQNLANHAYAIAQTCDKLPYFHHTLELMIHKALESDTSRDTGMVEEHVLPHVIRFMRQLPHYLSAVAHCARKTEMTQWEYLFQSTGCVQELLDMCLCAESLDTAVLYLIILQNLQPLHVSRGYIIKLLEASIVHKRWELGVELLRFLHAISYENDTNPKRKLTGTSDLVIRLRRSSESFDEDAPLSPITPGIHVPYDAPLSPITPGIHVPYDLLTSASHEMSDRKIAKHIITHHAHKLLQSCEFSSLGDMSYYLKFDLLQFLINEKKNLTEIIDPVHVFMSIHEEFSWPYPDIIPKILDHPQVSSNMNVIAVTPDSDRREYTLETLELEDKNEFISDSTSLYEDSAFSECRVEIDPNILALALKRGTQENENKISFFLDLFMKAEVYNYAVLFALALRNVETLVEVIKQEPSETMLSYLMAIDCWGHQESGGYSLFLQSLKPHIGPLFPTTVNDLKLKPLVKISSVSSINSASSISYDTTKRERAIRENSETLTRDVNNMNIAPEESNSGCSVS